MEHSRRLAWHFWVTNNARVREHEVNEHGIDVYYEAEPDEDRAQYILGWALTNALLLVVHLNN